MIQYSRVRATRDVRWYNIAELEQRKNVLYIISVKTSRGYLQPFIYCAVYTFCKYLSVHLEKSRSVRKFIYLGRNSSSTSISTLVKYFLRIWKTRTVNLRYNSLCLEIRGRKFCKKKSCANLNSRDSKTLL